MARKLICDQCSKVGDSDQHGSPGWLWVIGQDSPQYADYCSTACAVAALTAAADVRAPK